MEAQTLKTGRVSPQEREQIETLALRGLRAAQIARRMNRNPGTINFQMHCLGLKEAKPVQFAFLRNGKEVRSFSPEEDRFIEGLREQGRVYREIADAAFELFGYRRTPQCIGIRLKMLANKEEA